jgi:carboxypeptidase C (cathepsin A)
MLSAFFLSAIFLFQVPTVTPSATPTPNPQVTVKIGDEKDDKKLSLDEPTSVTKHSIRVGSQTLNYTVTTGYMPIREERTGETEAKLFFMAYKLDTGVSPAKRPLMFSFNGGPGSASVWLHLGALGPKRVKMLDNGFMPPPPYELIDNESTWLTETDLVFIDPVGTGFSRAVDPKKAEKFFGVNGDIQSVGEFIRLYLTRYERWSSPLFLVGESYGTTRAAGLSGYLFEKGIAFNGIALISNVMNFQTIRFADGNDAPLTFIFPSYASTAWYHKKLSADLQAKPLSTVLREAEDFAINQYAPALTRIDRLTPQEKQALLDSFSKYSGLSKAFIEQNNFRVDLSEFMKELLRERRLMTGRLDSRFTGYDVTAAGNDPDFDPSMTAIRTPYTATFNDYVRRELGFKSDLEYYILGGGITSPWNWNVNNGYANTSIPLSSAMRKNPFMKVFVASGYYDMATPYFATEYTLSNMSLEPTLRQNITQKYYEAGHMMYIEKNSLEKLKQDVSAFIVNSLPK